MKTYYGLTDIKQLEEIAVKVCDCLGHGKNLTAVDLLLETAGAETKRGTYQDPTKYAGMGITQFDKMPFYDIRDRTSKKNKLKVYNCFGIHLDYVEWTDLRYNPLLAMIMTRLKYLLVKEHIPPDFVARAKYWKKYYNSYKGKGTPEHYIEMNREFMA